MTVIINQEGYPALGEGTLVVRGRVNSELPTDELILAYITDAVAASGNDQIMDGNRIMAQERADDTRLDLEELIAALEWYEEKVSRALELHHGLHTEWLDGGYLIWRDWDGVTA
jgi:hypothetical protein